LRAEPSHLPTESFAKTFHPDYVGDVIEVFRRNFYGHWLVMWKVGRPLKI
jgi:hypothetical protein